MTEVEKDKLLDLLFNNNEKLMSELAGLREAMERQSGEMANANATATLWQQRAIAAEQRAEKESVNRQMLQSKIDELLTLVRDLQNGEELKTALSRAEKAEKKLSDLLASDRNTRCQIYGSKSQKSRKNEPYLYLDMPTDEGFGERVLH